MEKMGEGNVTLRIYEKAIGKITISFFNKSFNCSYLTQGIRLLPEAIAIHRFVKQNFPVPGIPIELLVRDVPKSLK